MARAKGPLYKLKITGLTEAEAFLQEIGDRSYNMKPVLMVIKEIMRKTSEGNFQSEGELIGHKWELDTPDTIEKKLASGYSNQTEVMEGNLYDSLTSIASGNGAVRRISRHSTTFGTNLFYAHWQGHKRELLGITMFQADNFAERMIEYLVGGVA